MQVRHVMRRNPITVAATDDLSLALQIMLWNGIRHLPVVQDGHLVGILSERDILAHRGSGESIYDMEGKVQDAMSGRVRTISSHAELSDAAGLMAVDKLGCLPVVDAGALIGIVTTTDLLANDAQCLVTPMPTRERDPEVGALMTRDPIAVMPDEPLLDATARMLQRGTRHLAVVDGLRRVVGILSDRDVRTAIGNPLGVLDEEGPTARLGRLKVSDAMTPSPRVANEHEHLSTAIGAFLDERFGALPVVDDEQHLVGMLSYLDILTHVAPS